MFHAVKFTGAQTDRIGGYLVVWGSPEVRDLHNEYFTPETKFYLDWYDKRPALYQHGQDPKLKSSLVGIIDAVTPDDVGLWAEAQLNEHNQYLDAIRTLIERGALAWSSGSVPHLAKVAQNGKILEWPIVEGTLTPTPAEPRHTDIHLLKSLIRDNPDFTALKAMLEINTDAAQPSAASPIDLTVNLVFPDHVSLTTATPTITSTVTTSPEVTKAMPENEEVLDSQEEEQKQTTNAELGALVGAVLQALNITLDPQQLDELIAFVQQQLSSVLPASEEPVAAAQSWLRSVNNRAQFVNWIKTRLAHHASPSVDPALLTQINDTAALMRGMGGQSRTNAFHAPAASAVTPNIQVRSKYADLTHLDLSYLYLIRNHYWRFKMGRPWVADREFVGDMVYGARKAYEGGKLVFSNPEDNRKFAQALTVALKANELNHSTLTAGGDEWVPTLWSDQLWQQARMDNVVLPLFQVIEMPSNPFELPVESTDPVVYRVPETTDESQLTLAGSGSVIPDSKVTTGKVTLTADKLALRVGFSAEVEEDSIIPFIPQLRQQAQAAIETAIDYVILNADNTASGNINLDGGTPGATDKYMMAWKGLRYNGLVANSGANALSAAGAAPTVQLIRELRNKLPIYYRMQISNLAIICDAATGMKLLSIPEYMTMDKAGALATILTGQLGAVDGIPLFISGEQGLTATNGKTSSTGGNNLYGSLHIIYRPGFYVGYRRRIASTMEYLSYYDSYQLTLTVRIAGVARDATSVASLYYLAV